MKISFLKVLCLRWDSLLENMAVIHYYYKDLGTTF